MVPSRSSCSISQSNLNWLFGGAWFKLKTPRLSLLFFRRLISGFSSYRSNLVLTNAYFNTSKFSRKEVYQKGKSWLWTTRGNSFYSDEVITMYAKIVRNFGQKHLCSTTLSWIYLSLSLNLLIWNFIYTYAQSFALRIIKYTLRIITHVLLVS